VDVRLREPFLAPLSVDSDRHPTVRRPSVVMNVSR
jgi:hypothetical protein